MRYLQRFENHVQPKTRKRCLNSESPRQTTQWLPRPGGGSKKQRTKTRLAAEAAPNSRPDANFFNDLAPLSPRSKSRNPSADEAAPPEPEVEEPTTSSGDVEQPAEGAAQASSLAEDVMAAPSPFPPGDPVRLETAACLRRCMHDGTTPLAWVLQLVMPPNASPVDGPTAAQMGEVRGVSTLPKLNLDVAFEGAATSQTDAATPIQQSSSSDSSSHPPLTHLANPCKQHVHSLLRPHPLTLAHSSQYVHLLL